MRGRSNSDKTKKKPAKRGYYLSDFFDNVTLLDLLHQVGKMIDEHGEDAVIDYSLHLGYYDAPECDITVIESVDRTMSRD